MPDGFCPPFQCHSGIIANSTMHQPKAIATQTFSALCAGFHQTPGTGSRPVCTLVSMRASRERAFRHGEDLPQAPPGVDEQHHQEPEEEEEEDVVEEALQQR